MSQTCSCVRLDFRRRHAMRYPQIPSRLRIGCLAVPALLLLTACGRVGEATAANPAAETVTFTNGTLQLHGLLYKPKGAGPFPAVLYNHGSAPGLLNNQAFDAIAPVFVSR